MPAAREAAQVIRLLMELLPQPSRSNLTEDEQDILTDYATGARYPGWGEIPVAATRKAVAMARRVRKGLRSTLPKDALRRQ